MLDDDSTLLISPAHVAAISALLMSLAVAPRRADAQAVVSLDIDRCVDVDIGEVARATNAAWSERPPLRVVGSGSSATARCASDTVIIRVRVGASSREVERTIDVHSTGRLEREQLVARTIVELAEEAAALPPSRAESENAQQNGSSAPPAAPVAPRRRDPGPRIRGGLGFPTGGAGGTSEGYGRGVGMSVHLGAQINDLLGVYVNTRVQTLLLEGAADMGVTVDFTLRDRVQIGLGIESQIAWSGDLFGGLNSRSVSVLMPFHLGITPALWHLRDGRRTGFTVALDAGPGIGYPHIFCGGCTLMTSSTVAFTASGRLGWEWY